MTTETLAEAPEDIRSNTAELFRRVFTEHTSAVFRGSYESGSPEWHALRATGIGGSEVGTICGLNRWESAYTLWAKKTGVIDGEVPMNEAMEWGHRLEPVVLEKFAETHGDVQVIAEVGTWSHPDRPWQIANPDGVFFDGHNFGIVEVKTAQYEDDWSEGVPRYYETQVQWYLQTFGFERAYVVVLFHGNRYREHEVIANPLAQDAALEQVELFRSYLSSGTAPDYDGALSTLTTVREMHPEILAGETIDLDPALDAAYAEAKAELDAADSKMNEAKVRIMAAMGNVQRGFVGGVWRYTRSARSGGAPFLNVKKG